MMALPAESANSGSFSRNRVVRGWGLAARVNLESLLLHAAAELCSAWTAEGGCPHATRINVGAGASPVRSREARLAFRYNHPANEVIGDEKWLKEEFISSVQQRGAAVIKTRGLSSAGSAANAIVDTVRFLTNDTPRDDWHSVAVCSDGSYDVEKDLISSFPVRVRGGKWEIVQNIPINEFSRAKIDASVAELKEEKSLVSELIS